MRIAVTIIGCILILPGAFIVATNWYCYIRWHLTQLRNPRSKCSDGTVLLLSGLMLSVGLVCLIAGLKLPISPWYAALGLLIDNTGPLFAPLLILLLNLQRRRIRRK